jgi:hypothetical protein
MLEVLNCNAYAASPKLFVAVFLSIPLDARHLGIVIIVSWPVAIPI